MVTYCLLIVAFIFFVWGLILIVKGWQGPPEDDIIALSGLEEITEFPSIPAAAIRPSVSLPVPLKSELEESRVKVSLLEKEIAALEEKAVQQARKDQEEIVRLAAENSQFQKQIAEQGLRLGRFEEKVFGMQTEKEQLLLSHELVDDLKSKNQRLQERCEEGNVLLRRLEDENRTLLAQAEEKDGQIQDVRKNLELMQKSNNQKLNEAHETISLLQVQKQEGDRARENMLNKELSEAMSKLETLNQEKEDLSRAKTDLENNLRHIKEVNAHLLGREKILRHELTKNRAQAIGWEKICGDFKTQIEHAGSIAKD